MSNTGAVYINGREIRKTPYGELAVTDAISAVKRVSATTVRKYKFIDDYKHLFRSHNFRGGEPTNVAKPGVLASLIRNEMRDVHNADEIACELEEKVVADVPEPELTQVCNELTQPSDNAGLQQSPSLKRKRVELLDEVTSILVRAAASEMGTREYTEIRDYALALLNE